MSEATLIEERSKGSMPKPPDGKSGWPWHDEGLVAEPACDVDSWPKISIVTPSYNQGEYIEETIRSVLMQRYPNLEYIVIDGLSQDGTGEVLGKYSRWINHCLVEKDEGQCDAINKGFEKASGEIFGWINSDDLYRPGALHTIARHFMANKDSYVVYGEAAKIDQRSNFMMRSRCTRKSFGKWYILNCDPIVQPTSFWRSGVWKAVGGLDKSLCWGLDWDYFIRVFHSYRIDYIPVDLALCRIHDKMKTRNGGIVRYREMAEISKKYGGWWQPMHLLYHAMRPFSALMRSK
ncbi:MAG: glycosyltransferase family 2 protein [Dehalococcoidales bacterium]|nr:glycosyltransferase family 2 protein [Dehalococcoidales bacterium]